jgi:Pyridoxamine 5'-phosphate oxidase
VSRVPGAAERILSRGGLCYLGVRTPWGPHLTPLVHVFDGGRLWVSTSRGSVKARAWRRDPEVAGLVIEGGSAATFRGHVTTYDAFDPLSWPSAVLAGPRLVEAATRFSLKNARFFAGYAVDAGKVPLAWTPPGRVFASVRPAAGRVLAAADPADGPTWGDWRPGSQYRRALAPLPPRRGLDLAVPLEVRRIVGTSGTGALAVEGSAGLTVLPVAWRRSGREGAYEAMAPAAWIELAGAGPEAPAALTVDRASSWRAADMAGMLLQGTASLFSPQAGGRGRRALLERLDGREDLVLIRIRPHRAIWWKGWTSGRVTGERRLPRARGRVAE